MASSQTARRFDIVPYRRPFTRPMETSWGTWTEREGYIIRLTDAEGKSGFGEVAPLAAFGSESIETAGIFLAGMESIFDEESLEHWIQSAPPACAFGLWSANQELMNPLAKENKVTSSVLLPDRSIESLIEKRSLGFRTYKLKLGTGILSMEQDELAVILDHLVDGEQIRLDPNRSWDLHAFESWTHFLEPYAGKIDFIEEPFAQGIIEDSELLQLANSLSLIHI